MKLSEPDKENIEVLESLDISEVAFFKLIYHYFVYRSAGYLPDQALEATIRLSMGVQHHEIFRKKH